MINSCAWCLFLFQAYSVFWIGPFWDGVSSNMALIGIETKTSEHSLRKYFSKYIILLCLRFLTHSLKVTMKTLLLLTMLLQKAGCVAEVEVWTRTWCSCGDLSLRKAVLQSGSLYPCRLSLSHSVLIKEENSKGSEKPTLLKKKKKERDCSVNG